MLRPLWIQLMDHITKLLTIVPQKIPNAAPFVVFKFCSKFEFKSLIILFWYKFWYDFIFVLTFNKSSSVNQRNLASFCHRFHCGCSSNMFGCELYVVCSNQMLQTNSSSVVDGNVVSELIQILAWNFMSNIIVSLCFNILKQYLIFRTRNVFKRTRNVPTITH